MRIVSSVALILLFLGISSTTVLALERQPNPIYQARRETLARGLHGGVALLFGNYEPAMEYEDFRQDEDFYYLTGWNEPGAALIVADAVPARAGKPALPYREVLLLPERNLRMELFTGVKRHRRTSPASPVSARSDPFANCLRSSASAACAASGHNWTALLRSMRWHSHKAHWATVKQSRRRMSAS
jgi:aminopeptidase P-like protein